MTVVDIQFSPANTDWPTLRRAARTAEERGYGAIWVLDHLAGRPLGGDTMIEAFTLLGALAEATERIELGTMVANAWNRRPGTLVTAIASVAHVADRQVHLGVGAGTSPTSRWADEQHAAGHRVEPDLPARHARVGDVVALAEAQWRDDRDQRYETFPLPRPRPTVIIGSNSCSLCEFAAERSDGVNLLWRHPRRDEFIAAFRAAQDDRDPLLTTYAVFDPDLLDPSHPDREEMADRGVDRVVLAVFDDLQPWIGHDVAPNQSPR